MKKILALLFFAMQSLVAQGSDTSCMAEFKKSEMLATNQLWDRYEEKMQWLVKNCADTLSLASLYGGLAEAQGEQKKYKQSLASADKCLKLDATEPECNYRKVLALQKIGTQRDVDNAKENLQMACRIVPKSDMVKTYGCQRVLKSIQ